MPTKCPKCGSASSQKLAPARIAAGRMKDPSFLAMLAVNMIDEEDMDRAAVPNAPDRRCASCGTGFRARLTRCPGCGSSRLARVLHRMEREGWNYWMMGKWKKITEEVWRRMWREDRDCPVGESGAEQDPITADAILREAWECLVGEEAAGRRRAAEAEAAEAKAVRRNAEQILAIEDVVGRLRAEFLRLLNDSRGAVAEWKAMQAEMGFVSLPHSVAINRPMLACAECPKRFRPRPVRCPECGSGEIAWIWYGYYPNGNPDKDGWVVLGGCVVEPYRLSCRGCGHRFGKVRL